MADKLDKLLDEATSNIREDRKLAQLLLEDAIDYISQNQDRHKEVGIVASKYLETLQRSNEQLVKIAAIAKSKLRSQYGDLDGEEKEGLYDEIESETEEKKDDEEA